MAFEGMSTRSLMTLFGIVAAGGIVMVAIFGFGLGNPATQRPTITEEVIIKFTSSGQCIVDTEDSVLSAKTINGCDLPIGTKVTISYQKGLANAQIVSQAP
jgi:hypothetical protein